MQAQLAPAALQRRLDPGRVGQHLPDLHQEPGAGGGQRDVPGAPVDQLGPELALQTGHLPRQRRLPGPQPLRGAPEVQLLGQHDERGREPQVERLWGDGSC